MIPYIFDKVGIGGVPGLWLNSTKPVQNQLFVSILKVSNSHYWWIPVSYFADGAVDYARLISEFGVDKVVLHLAQCLAKIERIIYELDKTWNGTVEDLPPERAMGLYGIYDAAGFEVTDEALLPGNERSRQ